jgi:hypothetical protein
MMTLLLPSKAGQPRGDCPYLTKNSGSVGAAPPCQPQTSATAGILSAYSKFINGEIEKLC